MSFSWIPRKRSPTPSTRGGLRFSPRRRFVRRLVALTRLGNDSGWPLRRQERGLACWAADLATRVSAKTVRQYLASVCRLALECGFPKLTKDFFFLTQVLKGIDIVYGAPSPDSRAPVTCRLLARIARVVDLTCFEHAMMWAAMTLATFGLLRAGEFALPTNPRQHKELTIHAIRFDYKQDAWSLTVNLPRTKTHTHGDTIHIGETFTSVCAVRAMTYFLSFRARMYMQQRTATLFTHADGSPLTVRQLVSFLHRCLGRLNIDKRGFSGHSFRIGGATSMAQAGFRVHDIHIAGRWKSDSYLRYIRHAGPAHAARARRMIIDG